MARSEDLVLWPERVDLHGYLVENAMFHSMAQLYVA